MKTFGVCLVLLTVTLAAAAQVEVDDDFSREQLRTIGVSVEWMPLEDAIHAERETARMEFLDNDELETRIDRLNERYRYGQLKLRLRSEDSIYAADYSNYDIILVHDGEVFNRLEPRSSQYSIPSVTSSGAFVNMMFIALSVRRFREDQTGYYDWVELPVDIYIVSPYIDGRLHYHFDGSGLFFVAQEE